MISSSVTDPSPAARPAVLHVVALSDSFSALWEPLARETGMARAEIGPAAPKRVLGPVVVAAGGAESLAAEMVRGVPALASIAVAGAAPPHEARAALLASGAAAYFALPGDAAVLRDWLRAHATMPGDDELAGHDFSALVGRSAAMRAALRRAARVVPHRDAPVLVTGETGTGKQLLAEAIHRNGPRGGGPFVEVNCAALPGALLEAELFGYERGAFTDARTAKAGLFELADGGTLFLDEIGDLPLALQGKLLSALERRRTRRLGGTQEHPIDARIIAATHVELGEAVREGRFRADLFFRLDVVRLHLPPLRAREDDAVLLAEQTGRLLAKRHGLTWTGLDEADRAAVRRHRWPGNVRELRNVVERALLCGEPVGVQLAGTAPAGDTGRPLPHPEPPNPPSLPRSMRELEREAARDMVARCGGNKSRAALALGVSRKRLYALLAELDGAAPLTSSAAAP